MSSVKERPRTAAAAETEAIYDADHFTRCQCCGAWVNGSDPSQAAKHRGPLPHPVAAGAEWVDDDP